MDEYGNGGLVAKYAVFDGNIDVWFPVYKYFIPRVGGVKIKLYL